MQVVASLKVSNSQECSGPICAGAMAPAEGPVDLDYAVCYHPRARLCALCPIGNGLFQPHMLFLKIKQISPLD